MSKSNSYTEICEQITSKIKASNQAKGRNSSAVSRSDLEAMTTALLNSPDHEVTVYTYGTKDTSGTGEPVGTTKKPSKRYRDALKPMLKTLGLDKHDADRIDEIALTKEHAAAMLDVSMTAVHDYMRAGRKYSFPITNPDETRMEIKMVQAPERTSVGNRFNKDTDDDPTTTITSERYIINGKNQTPYWLKKKITN